MTRDLEAKLQKYWAEVKVRGPGRADTVLALLRIGTREALSEAELIVGKPITRCPPAVPPWPPKPARSEEHRVVVRVERNPCLPTTDAFQRFKKIRVGMTEPQVLRRGVTKRDIRRWSKSRAIELSESGAARATRAPSAKVTPTS